LRILHLAPLYQPIRDDMEYGSIERLVLLLDKGFSAAGHDVATIAREGSEVDGGLVPVSGASGYAEQVDLALEIAADSALDVIQVHRREFFDLGGAAVARREWPQAGVVATLHGAPGTVRRYYGGYGPLASFVFVSKAQAAGVPELPGTVILNGVDTVSVPFRRVAASPAYLSFLGRISGEKGVAEAIGLARQAGLPLKIAGVVQDGDRQYFESAVVPHLRAGHAEFLGPMRDAAKYELLGGSTALVLLPNYEDPCPVVALEALATGTPVLALARGGLPELVTDGVTGLIADDLPGLLDKLPGLGGISRGQCRAAAVARFGADRLARDYAALYRGMSQPSSASDR
jgi:glycosyltransferase involved in cell wall biosynthesis